MSTNTVSIFPSPHRAPLNERMEALRENANEIAGEHSAVLLRALEEAAELAEQVASGGEAYQVGLREIARIAHIELRASALNLRVLLDRMRQHGPRTTQHPHLDTDTGTLGLTFRVEKRTLGPQSDR